MSVTISTPHIFGSTCDQSVTRLPRRTSSNMSSSRQGMLGSLKQRFSRNPSVKETERSFRSPMGLNKNTTGAPAHSPAPPTRRPNRPGMNAFTVPSNEPPPAYSPPAPASAVSANPSSSSAATATAAPAPAAGTVATADDPYAFLCSFDTVFLIDDSGSMAGRSWRETKGALETITPICTAHDADGIDLHFLNAPDAPAFRGVRDLATVRDIFSTVRPQGGTPTGQRLNRILSPYLARYRADPDATKPLNVIVVTDGEPSDDVESVIIAAARKLDKLDAPAWQVGVQFFQVGKEPGAREHLRQLDDELAELAGGDDLRDIVDTVPYTGEGDEPLNGDGILKVVLGAVNRRLDRKRSKELHRKDT